jgi:hypothetical protein
VSLPMCLLLGVQFLTNFPNDSNSLGLSYNAIYYITSLL